MSADYHQGRVRARCTECELRTPSIALEHARDDVAAMRRWTDAHLMQWPDHEVVVEYRSPEAWIIFHSERGRIDVRVVA